MGMSDQHPGASSYVDRHGKRRWRSQAASCPDPSRTSQGAQFEAAYQAALERRPPPKPASVHRLPTAASARSLKAYWRILRTDDPDWKALGPSIKQAQLRITETFLKTPVVEGEPLLFESVDVEHLKRPHVRALLARKSDTPHAAAHLLRCIRKLVGVALDQE